MSTAKASQKLGAVPNAPYTKFFEIDLQSCVIGTGLNQACSFNVKAETIFFLLCHYVLLHFTLVVKNTVPSKNTLEKNIVFRFFLRIIITQQHNNLQFKAAL